MAIRNAVADLPIKTICCSPMLRAKQTKDIIAGNLDAEHFIMEELSECDSILWPEMMQITGKKTEDIPPSIRSFFDRSMSGFEKALKQPGPVLIVAHGGVHWSFCYQFKVAHEWKIGNCVLVHFSPSIPGSWQAGVLASP